MYGHLLHWTFVYSLASLSLFTYFVCKDSGRLQIYILGYNRFLLYFFPQIFPALAFERSFSQIRCLFDTSSSLYVFIFVVLLSTFPLLTLQDDAGLSFAYLSSPRISYFSRDLVLFSENDIRSQNLGARCTCHYWVSIILGLLS